MSVKFFLGANSAEGFKSLYDGFASDKGDRLRLIKGGPGCGKSCFMRRLAAVAEEKGFSVEYILCSGDPNSLDGIYFPEMRLGYADATAPHILEPRHFGYDSHYVNLGQFCSELDDDRIPKLTEKYRDMYKAAYGYLAAAGNVKSAEISELLSKTTISGVKSCAKSAAKLSTDFGGNSNRVRYDRYIHSIGCEGETVLTETATELCKQIYLIDDRLGLSHIYFEELVAQLGGRLICCMSPLLPERIEAVILPDEGLGFIAASLMPSLRPKRRVRLDALVPKDVLSSCRDKLRRRDELAAALIKEAVRYLESAKKYHDELEALYRDAMDFDALDDFTEAEINALFY